MQRELTPGAVQHVTRAILIRHKPASCAARAATAREYTRRLALKRDKLIGLHQTADGARLLESPGHSSASAGVHGHCALIRDECAAASGANDTSNLIL